MNAVSLLFHDVYASDPSESGFRSPAADRYKLSIPEFESQLEGLARIPAVFTFDDGGQSYHSVIADRLEACGWRGHCFVTTDCVGKRGFLTGAQIRELDARGHVIGSHSATHPARFSALTIGEMRGEWAKSRQTLEDLLGRAVIVASVPGGYFSTNVAKVAAECGFRTLFTSEPSTRIVSVDGCSRIGRFTIRRGHAPDMARRFALPSPWTRWSTWAAWNSKAVVKPLLGPSYARIADLLLSGRTSANHG